MKRSVSEKNSVTKKETICLTNEKGACIVSCGNGHKRSGVHLFGCTINDGFSAGLRIVPDGGTEDRLGGMEDGAEVVEVVLVDLSATTVQAVQAVQAAEVVTVAGTGVAVAVGTVAGRLGRHGRISE